MRPSQLAQGDAMQVILYRRVSTAEQGDSRNGLEAQALTLHRFAQVGGHEIVSDAEEVASGKLGLDRRPVLRAAFDQARRGHALVLVSKLDRLSRSVEFVAALMNSGARFGTVEDGLEVQPFQLHLKAMLAEHERKTIGERTKAALGALRARGVPVGIPAHADPSSGARARAAAALAIRGEADSFALHVAPVLLRMRASGMTCAAMAAELNTQGNRTARGGNWHASTVCTVLGRLGRMGVQ
jgi:DNA invertase Pin-like site-specific DNA recombinase